MNRSTGELKSMARQMLLGNYRVPILAMLLASLIPSLFLLPFQYLCSDRDTVLMQQIIYYLADFIISLIEILLAGGVSRIHLKLARKQPIVLKDMFWVIENRPDRFILGGLLLVIIETLPFAPLLLFLRFDAKEMNARNIIVLSVLFLVGMIIDLYLAMHFSMVFILYADDVQINVIEAFRLSIKMMKGHKIKLFLMQLSFIGYLLLGVLSLGIGLLWVSPYMTQSATNFYLELKHEFDVTVEIHEMPYQTEHI